MENFIIYLGKASILLTIFFLAYYFLLRKETFFNGNRWFLLLGIFTSLALPLFVFTKIIWIEPVIQDFSVPIENDVNNDFASIEKNDFEINWFYIIGVIYVAGVLFFSSKFITDLFSLLKIINHKKTEIHGSFKFIDSKKIQSPFSFFKYIIFNSNAFQDNELQNIIAHEKVHSSQYHSIDMLVSQVFCIFFWFNPFSWLHTKAIAQNLEFIADHVALRQVLDKIYYQKTLLKVSAPHQCIPITNHFYQSLIKKRIVMLNKNQSKRRNSWKYASVLPLLTVFMLQFQVETVAQEKEKVSYVVSSAYYDDKAALELDAIMVLSSTSENDIKDYVTKFTESKKIKLSYNDIKKNEKGKIIEISFSYDDFNGTSGTQKFSNEGKPISGILFEVKKDANGKNLLKISDLSNSIVKKGSYVKDDVEVTISDAKSVTDTNPVLIVVDGKIVGMSDKVDMPDSNIIAAVTVVKNNSAKIKYGEDGKNGVIEIITKGKNGSDEAVSNLNIDKSEWAISYENDVIVVAKPINGEGQDSNLKDLAIKKYDGSQNNSVVKISKGDANRTIIVAKKQSQETKMFTLKNGDEAVIYDGNKLKLPGAKTVLIDNETFTINGKKATPEDVKALKEISKIDIIYSDSEKVGIKKVKIKTP